MRLGRFYTGRFKDKNSEGRFGDANARWSGVGSSQAERWGALSLASLDLDFVQGQGRQGGAVRAVSAFLTTTRASTAYADNAAGTWSAFSSGIPRITDLGLLVEESRTNSIRNNSMQGASAPSTLPTNWGTGNLNGLTLTVVGTGTENGIDYIEIAVAGTTDASSATEIYFENGTQIVASSGQTWTESVFCRLVSGSWTNLADDGPRLGMYENTSDGSYVTQGDSASFAGIGSTYQRLVYTYTLAGGGTVARVRPLFNLVYASGVAIDVTFRIGWPQLELGSFATSPIRTTSGAATRAADAVTLTTNPISGTTWSAFVDATLSNFATTRYLLAESASNRVLYTGADTSVSAYNGTNIVGATAGSGGWSTGGKAAVSADGSGRSIVMNNGLVGSDANTQAFPTTLGLGGALQALGAPTIRRMALWPTRLTNAQLQALTA